MGSNSMVAILAVAIIFGVAALRTTHAFVIHVDRTKAAAAAAAASKKCAPLHASVPDTAPKILDGVVVTKKNNVEAYNDNNLAIQNSILRIAASTDRGQNSNSVQRERISRSIASLVRERIRITTVDDEGGTDIMIPSYLSGTWELLYSNAQLFRSSPFFMAGRSTCTTPERAARYDWFCDMHRAALAVSTIGTVRQIITSSGRLVNEFEVKVGAVPFLSDVLPAIRYSGGLPFTIDGAIVSTADVTKTMYNEDNLMME